MDLQSTLAAIFATGNEVPPNESNTCDWIILPILSAIGYGRREILSRIADGAGKFPDYTIFPNDTVHQFYLEAKAWSVELQNEHAIQALNYANANGKRWVVLANGQCWRLYDNRIQGTASEKLITEVYSEDQDQFVAFLQAIGKKSVLADRIAEFAEAQLESKRRATEQRTLAEAQYSRRKALSNLIAEELQNFDGKLVSLLVDFCKRERSLQNMSGADVVHVLGEKLGVSALVGVDSNSQDAVSSAAVTGGVEEPAWYVNIGEGPHRNWDDNVQYGYIGAGQGPRWSQSLKKLNPGDRIYAYLKACGFVGHGTVLRSAVMIRDFQTEAGAKLLECPLRVTHAADNKDDPVHAEWVVAIKWLKTFPRQHAKYYAGIFTSQHVACRLSNQPETLAFLAKEFALS